MNSPTVTFALPAFAIGAPAGIAALAIAGIGACAAVFGAWHARRAFLGQNFLKLMEALQADRQRTFRRLLKGLLHDEGGSEPIAWTPEKLTPEAEAAEEVSQLFDQVAILADEGMIGRRAILNNWSATLVEMFIVAYPVIQARRKSNESLWHSFEALAERASKHPSVSTELRQTFKLLPRRQ